MKSILASAGHKTERMPVQKTRRRTGFYIFMNKNDTNKELWMRFLQAKHEHQDRFAQFKKSDDVLAERIMENIQSTPLGKLLGIIASLPEIRPEKVERGRWLLHRNESDLNEPLDEAMDRILEELLHESAQ